MITAEPEERAELGKRVFILSLGWLARLQR
jgi:hypothetical protein